MNIPQRHCRGSVVLACLAGVLTGPSILQMIEPIGGNLTFTSFAFGMVLIGPFALGAMAIGFCIYVVLARKGLVRWWNCMAVGGFLGALVSLPVVGASPEPLVNYAHVGAASGLVTWLVLRADERRSSRVA